jgi:hypothetical protein
MNQGVYFFIAIIGALLIGFICRYLEIQSDIKSLIGIIYIFLAFRIYRVQFVDRRTKN